MILHILGVGIYANDGHLPIRVVGPLHNFRCPQLKVIISASPRNQSPNRNIKAGNSYLRRGCHFRQTHGILNHWSTLVSGTNTTPTRQCKHTHNSAACTRHHTTKKPCVPHMPVTARVMPFRFVAMWVSRQAYIIVDFLKKQTGNMKRKDL